MKTVPYMVSDGVYPFDNIVDVIYVEEQDDKEAEAAFALQTARHGRLARHPTVEPM